MNSQRQQELRTVVDALQSVLFPDMAVNNIIVLDANNLEQYFAREPSSFSESSRGPLV